MTQGPIKIVIECNGITFTRWETLVRHVKLKDKVPRLDGPPGATKEFTIADLFTTRTALVMAMQAYEEARAARSDYAAAKKKLGEDVAAVCKAFDIESAGSQDCPTLQLTLCECKEPPEEEENRWGP
jgi:hypothetical protein